MKAILIVLCFAGSAYATSPIRIQDDFIIDGPKCPIDDPLHSVGPVAINGTANPFIKVQRGSALWNVNSEGFSSESWTMWMNLVFQKNKIDFKLDQLTGNATYSAHGYLDAYPLRRETLPSGNFTGAGFGKLTLSNVKMVANFTIIATAFDYYLKIGALNIESFSFDSVSIDLGEDFLIDGKTPNWAELSANFKDNFEQDFANDKEGVTELIRQAINGFTNYTFQDLSDLIDEDYQC